MLEKGGIEETQKSKKKTVLLFFLFVVQVTTIK